MKKITLIISFLMLAVLISSNLIAKNQVKETKIMTVTGGKIIGTLSEDSKIAIYKGIPYATPPVENLRWKAPQKVASWDGVKETKNFGASAIQPKQGPFMMWTKEFIIEPETGYSEDCLNLNVWTENNSSNNKKPVIVYIHGGGFTSGGSSCEVYDGEEMAKQGIVYVSINYRVGVLGFLAHPELSAESKDNISGNYGIMDQIAALNWVKDNIKKFGGDASNVTIMGQSAGSASVNALTMSPEAKGLFKNAFSMSYNLVDTKWDTLKNKEAQGKEAFKGMSLKDMRAMSTEDLLKINYNNSPVIDGKVLPKNLAEILKEGKQNDVNRISGMVEGDTLLFTTLPSEFFNPPKTLTKLDYEKMLKDKFGKYADECLSVYPANGNEAIAQYNAINQDGMMALEYYLGKLRNLKNKSNTYIYDYTYKMPGENSNIFGAFHTSDVPYFLNKFSSYRANAWTSKDYEFGKTLSTYLVNFAKTGNPNGGNLPVWEKVGNKLEFINLGDTIKKVSFSKEKEEFWTKYYNDVFGIN